LVWSRRPGRAAGNRETSRARSTVELLVELVRAGPAFAEPARMISGNKPIEMAQVRITEAGRRVLAEKQ
jgi:acyl-CoA synthetase (NDP forming)